MSFWLYTRGKGGQRHLWQIDTEPFAIMSVLAFITIVVGMGLILHPAVTGWLSVVFLLGGLTCLTISKISLYRQGIWISFGPGLMTRGYASLYKAAYPFMGVGALLMVLMLSVLRVLE